MLFTGGLLDRQVFHSANVRHGVANLFAHLAQIVLVFAKNLDGNLRIDARYEFVIASLYDLRKVELNAGKTFNAAAHGVN